MATKNEVKALIGGKIFKLSGYESNEYLQKVANYINEKISDLKENMSYCRQTYDMQKLLIELNIADDYFKAKKQADELEREVEVRDKEIYNLKHELVGLQLKLESVEKRLQKTQKNLQQSQKKTVQLETKLEPLSETPLEKLLEISAEMLPEDSTRSYE